VRDNSYIILQFRIELNETNSEMVFPYDQLLSHVTSKFKACDMI